MKTAKLIRNLKRAINEKEETIVKLQNEIKNIEEEKYKLKKENQELKDKYEYLEEIKKIENLLEFDEIKHEIRINRKYEISKILIKLYSKTTKDLNKVASELRYKLYRGLPISNEDITVYNVKNLVYIYIETTSNIITEDKIKNIVDNYLN